MFITAQDFYRDSEREGMEYPGPFLSLLYPRRVIRSAHPRLFSFEIFNKNPFIMTTSNQIQLKAGEGNSFWVLGDLYTFKVTGKETNGAFTVMDQIIQPQGGPPPHIHHREDEAFFILDGTFSFLCGDKETVFDKGSFVYVPKGVLHTFRNIGEQQGRLLVTVTPAGLEEFFYAVGSPARDADTPPEFDPAVIDKVLQLAKAYHMEVRLPSKV